jgi:hypothetical protein
MTELTLTQEQSTRLAGADSPVRVRDAQGRVVGYLTPEDETPVVLSPEELDKIARRLADDDTHYITTPELLQRLNALSQTGE